MRLVSITKIRACRQGGYDMGQEMIPWIIMSIAAIAAALAAAFTYFTARATQKATIASNLVNCLSTYIQLMRARTQALEAKSETQCANFYRELFDLHWSEFQIWRENLIPDHVMKAWLVVRHRNYAKDALSFVADNGQKVTITYKQVWDDLKNTDYFEGTDPLVRFMDKVHSEVIEDMKKLRKEFKRQ